MKGLFLKSIFIFIYLAFVFLIGCQSIASDKPACPARQVDSWLDESRIVLREYVEVMGMFESASNVAEMKEVAIAAEQVYRHQLQIEAPTCLNRVDELSEDQYYWMWKNYEAISKGNFDQADEYYDKWMIAIEEVERELDRVEREQGW